MTKTEIILEHARRGMNAFEIAEETGININSVYNRCQESGVKLPRRTVKRFSGTIVIRQRFCKSTNRMRPVGIIPTTAIRAAGLDAETRLAFRVVGKEIIISAAK